MSAFSFQLNTSQLTSVVNTLGKHKNKLTENPTSSPSQNIRQAEERKTFPVWKWSRLAAGYAGENERGEGFWVNVQLVVGKNRLGHEWRGGGGWMAAK